MISPEKRKLISFLGCALLHLTTGVVYGTGNILPYITSYVGYKSGYVSNESMAIVSYISLFAWSFAFQPAIYLQSKSSPQTLILAGNALFLTCVFVASALTTRVAFIIVYGVLCGTAVGMSYGPGLIIAIDCYPTHKGMVTGIIIGCFAFGSFIFNFVATAIANPNNDHPSLIIQFNGKNEKFFDPSIAQNLPKMFLILGGIYTGMLILANIMIKDLKYKKKDEKSEKNEENGPESERRFQDIEEEDPQIVAVIDKPENEPNDEENRRSESIGDQCIPIINENSRINTITNSKLSIDNGDGLKIPYIVQETAQINPVHSEPDEKPEANIENKTTFKQALKTLNFYLIFFTTCFLGIAGLFAVANFKVLGLNYGYSDSFVTIVGSLGSVMNGSNRPLWGLFFDRHYKLAYRIICIIAMIICFTFPSVIEIQALYCIWICLLYSCQGGAITQIAPISIKLYGKETGFRVYATLFLANGCAAMMVYLIQSVVLLYLSSNQIFYIIGGFSALGFIIISFFEDVKH